MEKQTDFRTGAGNIQDGVEHLVVPEREKVQHTHTHVRADEDIMSKCQRDTGGCLNNSQWPKLQKFEQENKQYWIITPKYKIDIHGSILINK